MSKTEKTPKKESHRVSRGGSWFFVPRFARVALRLDLSPGYRYFTLGVRLVEVLDE